MQIVIHRGTHQIGGVATEIRTASARILIDFGDELSLEEHFVPRPLSVPGVTDTDGSCQGVLFTHNHGDHVGQLCAIRQDIPLYMGALAKDVLIASAVKQRPRLADRARSAHTWEAGQPFPLGDLRITPFSVDHSACDSYMLLIEGEGKRVLHTGDFRLHGFRGKAIPKLLEKLVGKVDVLITEGTTLSRPDQRPVTEYELQQQARAWMEQYPYVFVLCASTNLERICGLSKTVPRGKSFVCDSYQEKLIRLLEAHWGRYSTLYRNCKRSVYGDNLLPGLRRRGFLMMVRDNPDFRRIMQKFDREKSILLYSMWDGYRTRPGSTLPDFLQLTGRWEPLHTSGHAAAVDLCRVIDLADPETVIPIHTERPERLRALCPGRNIAVLQDGEVFAL